MYQLLAPLITRPGPLSDPDAVWGLTDEENDTDLNSNTSFYGLWANSPSITTMLCMSSSDQHLSEKSSDNSKKQQHHRSTASLDWFKQATDHDHHLIPAASATASSPNRHASLPALSALPSPFLDSCYTPTATQHKKDHKRPTPTKSMYRRPCQKFMGNTALFGGGLVLLETTGRRPFSLIALQSSLRHMSHIRYAMLMDLPVALLAEQLTWVELTLYRYIKVEALTIKNVTVLTFVDFFIFF